MKEKLSVLLVVLLLATLCWAFDFRTIKAVGTIYIQADGSITPSETAISSLNNVTYTLTGDVYNSIVIERSNIVIDGTYHIVHGDGTGNGFTMQDVVNVTIRNTEIRDCFEGIQFFNSSNNLVTGNTIVENSYEGIGLYFSSDSEITGNTIANNRIGIAFYNSSSNLVVHNNIGNNTYQAYAEFSLNSWDKGYPSGGNYWSDHSGTDINGDGIGDTPHIINENNQDRYPLTRRWTNIALSDLTASRTIIGQGTTITTRAVVENQGLETENTNITVYANTTTIYRAGISIPSKSLLNVTFTWNTTGFEKGNYTISAVSDHVPGETETEDNNRILRVTIGEGILGDVNADGRVDMKDVAYIAKRFGSDHSSPLWDPNADLNDDGRIDMKDVATVARNFGKTNP